MPRCEPNALVTVCGFGRPGVGNHRIVRNRSVLRGFARRSRECSDFVELARRMSIPADIAIHEFMELGTRPAPQEREPAVPAELATIDS